MARLPRASSLLNTLCEDVLHFGTTMRADLMQRVPKSFDAE
jgi:hypothetical protein